MSERWITTGEAVARVAAALGASIGSAQVAFIDACRCGAVRARDGTELLPATFWERAHIDLDQGTVSVGAAIADFDFNYGQFPKHAGDLVVMVDVRVDVDADDLDHWLALPRSRRGNGQGSPSPRRRGPDPVRTDALKAAMLGALHANELSATDLDNMADKKLVKRFGGKRSTARRARTAALSTFRDSKSDNSDKPQTK